MASKLTGRTRTYTCSGPITISTGVLGPVVNGFNFSVTMSGSFGTMQNLLGDLAPSVFSWGVTVLGEDPGLAFVRNVNCGAIGGYGSTSGSIHVLLTGGPHSYTFSCDTEEISSYTMVGARYWAWVIQDRPKVGGTVSGSITFSGITQSFSNTIGAAYTGPIYAQGGHNMDISVAVDPGTQCLTSSSASIGATFMGQAFTIPWTHTYLLGGSATSTVDLTSGNSVVVSGGGSYRGGVQVEAIRQVTKTGTISGAINAFDVAYPTSIITEWRDPLNSSFPYTPFSFGDTITQDNYSVTVYGYDYRDGGFKTPTYLPWPTSVNGGDGLLCRMRPSSLSTNGENTPYGWDTALNARLTPFNACTIWQDASVIMDPCTSATGWTANVSISGGFINVNSASLSGIASKNYLGYLTEGYRYLEFDIQPGLSTAYSSSTAYVVGNTVSYSGTDYVCILAVGTAYNNATTYNVGDLVISAGVHYKCILGTVGNPPPNATYWAVENTDPTNPTYWALSLKSLVLTLNNWQYKKTMGQAGTLTTVRFDLMAPYSNAVTGTSIGFATSVSDSKYRITGGTALAPGWGIDSIGNLILTFPSGTGTYSIQSIRLKRDANTKLTFIQSDNQNVITNGGTQGFKFALSDTDGKRSFNINDIPYPASSTPGTQISAGSGTFSSQANLINGWHVTPNVSGADLAAWYFDWSLSNLCGAGAIYTGSAPSTYWFNKSLTVNPTQLQVQARAAYVLFTPLCGDLTNAGSFGSPFMYYTYEFLRQRTTGVAIDKTQTPISGQTVSESEILTGASSGSGSTDSAGRFITGSNYAKTVPMQKDILSGVTSGTGIIPFNAQNRDTLRISFNSVLSSAETYPFIMETILGQLHLAAILSGDVIYQRSDQTTPLSGWSTAQTVTSFGDVRYARMDLDPELSRIHLLVTRFTAGVYNVYWFYSDSDGADFTNGGLLAGSALGASVCCLNISATLFTWFVYNSGTSGPGTQQGKFSQGSGQSFGSVFTFKDSTNTAIAVADQGWSNVEEAKDFANRLVWCPILSGQTAPTVLVSSDNGLTWGPP